ncbi:hypothetical protein RRG08_005443 [Elysia crispata]|uniref:Uncharacterized protein n=1 Tax=Elysia crispata TaxID=231223 RepID=A0AAE1CQL6_9GAST|nr:hypothetical protein RRG08_005443 [Elysia crispata]
MVFQLYSVKPFKLHLPQRFLLLIREAERAATAISDGCHGVAVHRPGKAGDSDPGNYGDSGAAQFPARGSLNSRLVKHLRTSVAQHGLPPRRIVWMILLRLLIIHVLKPLPSSFHLTLAKMRSNYLFP